ncbi:MAG: hypothetical protein J6N54_00090 [Bacteroidales bacterium]|nr:hypothetical protein [Bacteroidales bacterium]
MSKIKIGAKVTAKVCPTKVTVSGTFQGYELQDREDPTSVCGKVFYVKDGMQRLDFVYVDSIKVCEDKNEMMRKRIINILTNNTDAHEEGAALYAEEIAWLKNYWKPSEEQMANLINVRDHVAQASGYWGESLSSLINDLQNYFSL